jgi:hypothetical protein
MGNQQTQEDIAKPIYHAVDWSKCLAVGSHPLQQYLNASWVPDDIDFACRVNSREEFNQIVEKFVQNANKSGVSESTPVKPCQLDIHGSEEYSRKERLGDFFVASCNVYAKGVKQPIQFIGLKVEPHVDLPSVISEIADLPACISYSMRAGIRIFHIPERVIEVLRTRRVSRRDIAFDRQDKYRKRGFKIV